MILALDPGNRESAYVVIDADRRPLDYAKLPNADLERRLGDHRDILYGVRHAAVEMVASYGMTVGADVFETCVQIGRFQWLIEDRSGLDVALIKRHPVKLHHCHSARATDANITQALVDRFAPGQPNRGKGTKAEPGWFYGFAGDVWQAMALAVYVADTIEEMP